MSPARFKTVASAVKAWRRKHLPCWGLLHVAWPFVVALVFLTLMALEAAIFLQDAGRKTSS